MVSLVVVEMTNVLMSLRYNASDSRLASAMYHSMVASN